MLYARFAGKENNELRNVSIECGVKWNRVNNSLACGVTWVYLGIPISLTLATEAVERQ
jgi:hypothetical protein